MILILVLVGIVAFTLFITDAIVTILRKRRESNEPEERPKSFHCWRCDFHGPEEQFESADEESGRGFCKECDKNK